MLTDTHAHLWWDSYAKDLEEVLRRAKATGVNKIIAPGTDLHTSNLAVTLVKKYPGTVYAAVGIHPEETINKTLAVTKHAMMFNAQIAKLRELIANNREYIVAMGEIGTDANTEELRTKMPEQKELFREQLMIAQEFKLPVMIHTRNSLAETLEVLDYMEQRPRGQFHCFSYDEVALDEILKREFYVSFCGNITWSKRLKKLLPLVPMEKLLLETDSPFMMPRDLRGEPLMESLRNEPANVRILAQLQAELRGVSIEMIEEQTAHNVKVLFGI